MQYEPDSDMEFISFKNKMKEEWNNREIKYFGISALDEIETFLLYNTHLNRKQAMKYLYQPEYNNC